jgi:hypothetical protein
MRTHEETLADDRVIESGQIWSIGGGYRRILIIAKYPGDNSFWVKEELPSKFYPRGPMEERFGLCPEYNLRRIGEIE